MADWREEEDEVKVVDSRTRGPKSEIYRAGMREMKWESEWTTAWNLISSDADRSEMDAMEEMSGRKMN